MGALDGVIQLILFVCFGVYVVMGMTLTVMGIIYMSDVGAVGATGSYLVFFGLCMLIVGGIAIFANLKQIWLILFVIEIVNIFLFLGLYIAIIIVVMMASGSSDPIRRASESAWSDVKPTLTVTGSDGASGIYCETMTKGCKPWYTGVKDAKYKDCLAAISKARGITVDATVNNCTALGDDKVCANLQGACDACDASCREQSIQDIKDQIVPASFFVLFLVVYFLVVIIWNNVMIGSDDLEGPNKIIGLVFNGILLLFALILTIMGLVGYFGMDCPNNTDCRPTSLVMLILLGVSTLGVAGVAVAGIQLNNNVLLRIATLIMCFVSIFLIMAGIVMGMSSGAIMDDMNYYYDTQYPKMRSALERADSRSPTTPGYCQMGKLECEALMLDGTEVGVKDKDGAAILGSTKINKKSMWKSQYYEAAKAADAAKPKAWLEVCKTTGICIYCQEFKMAAEGFALVNKKNNNGTITTASIAPNINFQAAVNGFGCKKDDKTAAPKTVVQFSANLAWQSDPMKASFIGICQADDKGNVPTPVPRNWTFATGEKSTGHAAVIANYDVTSKANVFKTQMASESWQLILRNHTRFAESPFWDSGKRGDKTKNVNAAAKYVGKCEMAISNHAAEIKYCPDDADTKATTLEAAKVNPGTKGVNVKDSYVGDCLSCRQGVGDSGMSFAVGGQTTWSKTDPLNRCLNYFVGHLRTECGASKDTTGCKCIDRFDKTKNNNKGCEPQDAKKNIEEMTVAAYTEGSTSGFCNYPDQQCKEKIQNSVESSLTTIAVFGVIFVLFFLGIIFFTLQAIHIYRGGGGDDDDDDDDDDE